MGKYIQSFKRYEMKYLLSSEQYAALEKASADMIRPDMYGDTAICSIYLDTEDFMFIRESIEKPVYKEKLRIRSYGVPEEGAEVFFEIKKKFRGIVYKRRISARESDIGEYALTGNAPAALSQANGQIFSEIDYIMKKYRPVPRMFVGYDRVAFEGISDPAFRVTFDRNIRSRTEELDLTRGDGGQLLRVNLTDDKGRIYTDGDYRLMEIKTDSAIPLGFAELLSELKIYPTSFSKYGEIYKQVVIPAYSAQKGKTAVC